LVVDSDTVASLIGVIERVLPAAVRR